MREETRSGAGVEAKVRSRATEKVFTRNFGLTCLSGFFFLLSVQMLLPAVPIYVSRLGGSGFEIGVVVAAFAVSSIFTRPFIGRLVDRGHASKTLFFGAADFVVSALAYTVVTSLGPLLALRLFQGLGMASFTSSTVWVIAEGAPRHRRGEAVGYFGASVNVAMALGPALGATLLESTDFTALFGLSALAAFVALGVSSRIRLPRRSVSSPISSNALICRSAVRPSIVNVAMCFTIGTCFAFVPVYVVERNLGNPGLFFTAFALAMIVSRPTSGRAADKWGRPAVIIPGLILLVAGVASFSFGLDLWGVIAAGLVMGVGQGFANPGLMALVIDLAPPGERGSATSTLFAAFDLGVALGAVLAGVLMELAGYSASFLGAALVTLLGLVYFVVSLRLKARVMT